MIRSLIIIGIVTVTFVSCNGEKHGDNISLANSEPLDLPMDKQEHLVYKQLYQSSDTLITVFWDQHTGYLQRIFFLNGNALKSDTLCKKHPIKHQVYVQQFADEALLAYSPEDSIQLRIIFSDSIEYFTETDFTWLNENGLNFTDKMKLVDDFKQNRTSFEYRLMPLGTGSGHPMTAAFHPGTKEITLEGIHYPKRYQKNYYGFLHDIQEIYTDSLIIYNPLALPEIWIYNRETDEVNITEVRSRYQLQEVEPIGEKDKDRSNIKSIIEKHFAFNGNYTRLVYNPYLKCYYRFFQHAQPEKNTDGYFSTHEDRQLSFIQLNEKFEVQGEYTLPSECFFIYTAIPTPDGLIVNRGAVQNDTSIKFLKISTKTTL